MPDLSKVTDFDLFKQGLVSMDELEREGPVMNNFRCGLIDPQHEWGVVEYDMEDEPPYQVCRACGEVRRAPAHLLNTSTAYWNWWRE